MCSPKHLSFVALMTAAAFITGPAIAQQNDLFEEEAELLETLDDEKKNELVVAPIPIVNPTIGAGLDLAMSCDIRIASEDAKLGQFFVRMGLVPEAGAYMMPRLIGLGRAKLLSFTGDLIDGKEAERIGLVEKAVPADQLMPAALEMAGKFANGPKCIGIMKKQLNEAMGMTFKTALDYAIRLQYQCVHTEDHKEAVNAFLEKRKPTFKGE